MPVILVAVRRDNRSHHDSSYSHCCLTVVFLLSSKAGGVGLNLIGANRLVLFDPDWYGPLSHSDSLIQLTYAPMPSL